MKIKDITTEIKYIKLKTPFITSLRKVDKVEFIQVSIVCDDGSVGFGEAPSTRAITSEDIYTIGACIKDIKADFFSLTPKKALKLLHSLDIGSSAKASLDMALLMLMDFYKIEDKRSIKTDITISLNDKEKMIQDSMQAVMQGMNILKVKLGSDIKHALDVTKNLSKKVTSAKLLIDANQAWSLQDSLFFIDNLDGASIELIEQPVRSDDIESLKTITNHSDIPILADESVFSLEDVKKVIESKSADMINIKLMKCGGVSKAVEILEYARENKIICMLGSMLEGTGSINAALYLAFNYRDVIKYVDLDSPLLYEELPNNLDFRYKGCEIFI